MLKGTNRQPGRRRERGREGERIYGRKA